MSIMRKIPCEELHLSRQVTKGEQCYTTESIRINQTFYDRIDTPMVFTALAGSLLLIQLTVIFIGWVSGLIRERQNRNYITPKMNYHQGN